MAANNSWNFGDNTSVGDWGPTQLSSGDFGYVQQQPVAPVRQPLTTDASATVGVNSGWAPGTDFAYLSPLASRLGIDQDKLNEIRQGAYDTWGLNGTRPEVSWSPQLSGMTLDELNNSVLSGKSYDPTFIGHSSIVGDYASANSYLQALMSIQQGIRTGVITPNSQVTNYMKQLEASSDATERYARQKMDAEMAANDSGIGGFMNSPMMPFAFAGGMGGLIGAAGAAAPTLTATAAPETAAYEAWLGSDAATQAAIDAYSAGPSLMDTIKPTLETVNTGKKLYDAANSLDRLINPPEMPQRVSGMQAPQQPQRVSGMQQTQVSPLAQVIRRAPNQAFGNSLRSSVRSVT